jgi:ABC-type phosphate transport system auxiliary subunit
LWCSFTVFHESIGHVRHRCSKLVSAWCESMQNYFSPKATMKNPCRDTVERREEQLKSWLMEVRLERRRLEDRILQGGCNAQQAVRADIEAAISQLHATKVKLEGDVRMLEAEAADCRSVQVCS